MKIRRFLLLAFASILLGMNVTKAQSDCEINYSIYREAFKQWKATKYNPANIKPEMITAWRFVFNNCPDFKQTTYVEGVSIIANAFIRTEKDPAIRDKYIDTLIMVYDRRAEYYGAGQLGNIMGRKGDDIWKYNKNRYEEAYHALKQAIDLDGNNNESRFILSFFETVISMAKAGKLEESAILDEYSRLMEIVDYNIGKYTEEANQKEFDNFTAVKSNLDVAVQPYANCEDLVRIYQAKFDANPNDVELLNKIANTLDKRGCDDTELYLNVAVKLHAINPSPESAYLIGNKYLKEKNYAEASKFFEEATKSSDTYKAYQSYIYLAQIMNENGRCEQAYNYANKALALDRTKGKPYIIMGQAYAKSDCYKNDPFLSKTVFWIAVDQFEKAKQVEPALAADANKLIEYYSHYYPSTNDLFFRNLYDGNDYTYEGGCWIKGTTKVRASIAE